MDAILNITSKIMSWKIHWHILHPAPSLEPQKSSHWVTWNMFYVPYRKFATILDAILNISKCPRVPRWHPSDMSSIGIKDVKTNETFNEPNFMGSAKNPALAARLIVV